MSLRFIERPPSLAESVLERLREDIVSGDLKLGELLSERVLAERLGVSKTPVREALAQLRLEGLVRVVPQRGAFVFSLSSREVREICEFRQTLETAALKLSMERAPKALLASLNKVVNDMERARRANDRKAYLAADAAFHTAFFDHCGNGCLSETYALHLGKISALRTHLAIKPSHTEKSFNEHRIMTDLVAKGDLAGCLAVLDVHIDRTKSTYASGIEDIAEADASA